MMAGYVGACRGRPSGPWGSGVWAREAALRLGPVQRAVVARGGRGGRGNLALKTEMNSVPEMAELGEKGQVRGRRRGRGFF